MEKAEFLQGRKQFRAVNEYDLLAQSSWTRKILPLFFKSYDRKLFSLVSS